MVLAAGIGTRMRPLTLRRAKPTLPVLNRPLIHWTLERLAAAGVTDVVVNLHHRPASVRAVVGDGSEFGLRVIYSEERRILGTAGGPRQVRGFFGSEPFLLVNGDVLFDFDLPQLLLRHRQAGARASLALLPNPAPRRYTPVVSGRDGWIRSIAGRPAVAQGRRGVSKTDRDVSLFTGIHVLDPALLERLPPGPSDSVRDLYLPLLESGESLLGVRVRGDWYDFGEPSRYLASQLALLGVGRRSRSRRSLIHPEAVVAETARVTSSVVGPKAVIGEGAVVEESVLWGGARIGPGARVASAILDGSARVGSGETLRGRIVMGLRRFALR
jgi:NDP-sugar pyrophosphorylase family protein